MSRMMRFLTFCDKHGRAPPSVIAKAGRPTASLDPNDGPTGAEERRSIFAESPESPLSEPATTKDDVLTLEFDKRDVRELKHKRRELEEAKEEHGYWISILNEDPRDLETLKNCRHWRVVREGIGAEISFISERLRTRRQFRDDFNRIWADVE